MKKYKSFLQIALLIALFSAIVAYNGRPPANAPAPTTVLKFTLTRLSGTKVRSDEISKPTVFVFWASWCPPCKIELSRLQTLVNHGMINTDSVIAVDISEDPLLVQRTVNERGYTFDIATDPDGKLARLYGVNATPTVLFRNADGTVAWRSSGISPTLEWRVTRFAKQ